MTMLLSILTMGGPKVTLTPRVLAITTNDGSAAVQELAIRDTGNKQWRENGGGWATLDGDWIRPIAFSPGLYQARYTNATGDTGQLSCAQAAEDAWFALSGGDLIMYLIDNTSGAGTVTATFDLELRYGGAGGAMASAEHTMRVDRIDS